MNHDQLTDIILRLSLMGHTAPAIARRINHPLPEVRKIIREELAVPPGTIGTLMRPTKGGKIPEWKRERMVEAYHEGADAKTIAAELDLGLPIVHFYLRKYTDHEPPRLRRWTLEEDRYLVENLHIPMKEMAQHLGRSLIAVQVRYLRLREKGIPVYRRKGRKVYAQN
jgi:hypothetical protein